MGVIVEGKECTPCCHRNINLTQIPESRGENAPVSTGSYLIVLYPTATYPEIQWTHSPCGTTGSQIQHGLVWAGWYQPALPSAWPALSHPGCSTMRRQWAGYSDGRLRTEPATDLPLSDDQWRISCDGNDKSVFNLFCLKGKPLIWYLVKHE